MERWNPINQNGRDVLVVPRSALLPNDPASVECLIDDALGHPEGRAAFAKWLGVSADHLEDAEVRARPMRALTQGGLAGDRGGPRRAAARVGVSNGG